MTQSYNSVERLKDESERVKSRGRTTAADIPRRRIEPAESDVHVLGSEPALGLAPVGPSPDF
jgi:hypothetical protein